MLYTVVKDNSYQDSISLMMLTTTLSDMAGVNKVQVMMGTDANKDIFREAGLLTAEASKAQPSDMMIVMDVDQESRQQAVLDAIEAYFNDMAQKKSQVGSSEDAHVTNWQDALDALPDANVALISVPGIYAADEIDNALDHNLNAFVFSDNVSLADEARLKEKAHEKGLLVMGPDCGTGIISGVPMAFANVVRPGNMSLVGASGTGIQEVTTAIERLGGGVIHAIGTGGRDLSTKVGARTMMDALVGLANHDQTEVIGVISKPPAKEVRDEVVQLLHDIQKPVVAIFLGEKPDHHEEDVYLAHTLEETAKIMLDLAAGKPVQENYYSAKPLTPAVPALVGKKIKGLYSGGTLAYEAGMMISEALNLGGIISAEGYVLKSDGYDVIDLGDDIYTQGRPHPMIDPSIRIEKIAALANDPDTGVILLDDVLGYGTHPDMASALAPAIKSAIELAAKDGRELHFVGTIVGTNEDPQDYGEQERVLTEAGVTVCATDAEAVRYALNLVGKDIQEPNKAVVPYTAAIRPLPEISESVLDMLYTKPRVINVGVESFNEPITKFGGQSVQFDWKPVAGGDQKMIHLLKKIKQVQQVEKDNEEILTAFKQAIPYLIDVVPAKSVISELNGNHKVLLHAGPPIDFEDMTNPMQGSCVGAALFEGWAENEDDAWRLLRSGEVQFMPCHSVRAVGPMGGITSANMPVMVIENRLKNNLAFCTLNEGIGKVLRFGAYSQEVVDRLDWMRDVLGPTLSAAIKPTGGLNINVMMAKAITMGDEFHQRNIAASLVFLKEVAPLIIQLDIPEDTKRQVIQFLADTDQFFLNIMMATGKSIVDAARMQEVGTIVTTMTRNGRDFGIRIGGMGDQWFTAPVNTPQGLFFTGFSQADANPDIGDSAIAETVGFGGMSMIAAPGVTRFVGAGGFADAQKISNEMMQISTEHNPNFTIPTWDFQGTPLGIDIVKVVETGITPIINTGIAGKVAGTGQVGAGTVRAPLDCFKKALVAYAAKLGITADDEEQAVQATVTV
jgi:succinyl-CoA synthetase alpha subunit